MSRSPVNPESESARHSFSALAFLFAVLLAAVLAPLAGRAQIAEEEVLKLLAQYDLATARTKVNEICRKQPSSAAPAYTRALLTEDGEEAAALFDELLLRFRHAEHADRTTYRLAQYYFARGLYHSARKYFVDVMRWYPRSPLFGAAYYFAAKAWLAAGEIDSARIGLEGCASTYRSTWMAGLAQEDLNHLALAEAEPKPNSPTQFTVQIGAYSQRENALQQANRISALGYPVEVRERRQGKQELHLVWVGSFSTKEEAARYGDQLKGKIGGAFQIAKREP